MGLLLGFVIGRIQIVHAAFETRVHNRQVLVGKRHVDDDIRPESPHQRRQLLDAVGIHPGRLNPSSAHRGGYVVGLALGTARQHDFRKHRTGRHLVRHHGSHTAGSDYQYLAHC